MTDKQLKRYLGQCLKEKRIAADLSQEDIAKVIKLSRVSVLNMESGRHTPSLLTLMLLCGLYKCTYNDILPPVEAVKFEIKEEVVMIKKKRKVLRLVK